MAKPTILSRFRSAWNVFKGSSEQETYNTQIQELSYGGTYVPPSRRLRPSTEQSIVTSIYAQIANDVSAIEFRHARVDENGYYSDSIESGLNRCLTVEANIDQTGRALIRDAVLCMLDTGHVVFVPVDTTTNMLYTGSWDISTMRTGTVTQWFPYLIEVEVYNEVSGRKERIKIPKDKVAIVENPLYSVMNEPHSILRRLIDKLNLLDAIDEQAAAGKLDIIIQLPYTIRSQARQEQAEIRRKQVEKQLAGTKYGIAYIDGTERVTQLNRPAENNLMSQIEYLTSMLYSQLGMSQTIFDGTADENTMLNYHNRAIEPIVAAICDEMTRKFLTKTAYAQGQRILYHRDPFRLVTTTQIADMADRFTRNAVLSSNEIRAAIGYQPADDPDADELRNKNMYPSDSGEVYPSEEPSEEDIQGSLDDLDSFESEIDSEYPDLDSELTHYASPYYDPEKAHEYYEAHKKLKGRTSTATLNNTGKEAATYVKQQLKTEHKEKAKAMREEVKAQIKEMRNSLKGLKGAQRKARAAELKEQIAQIRADLKERLAQLKSAYDEQYVNELDAIRSESSMVKRSKRKKSK